MKLDLHGTYHSEVPPKVDRFLWECINDTRIIEADIVTGNSKEMKDIVIGVVKEHGFNYSVGNPWNKGFIRVSFLF
jgi:hypothetical protein